MTKILAIQTVGSLAERSGGPARTVASLCAALAATGIAVELVSGIAPADGALVLPPSNVVRPRLCAARRTFGMTGYPGFDAEISAAITAHPGTEPIVHDNGIWGPSNISAYRAIRTHRLRYVISPHGMLEPWALAYHAGRKKLAWLMYQQRALVGASGMVATAETERASTRALFPSVPIAVIANGVDCPVDVPATDPASTNVLFMSRIHPIKNLHGLLDAWAVICARPEFAAWRLTIAGPDVVGHLAEVRRHADKLGITPRVDFVGPVADADKAEIFARSAMFVLPSFSENFGIVAAEALAAGLPVIAARGTPWHELAQRGCGWWVDPTPNALAAALISAMSLPPAARRAMGVRGHGWVAAAFGWDKIAAATASFYRWLIDGGRSPDFVDV